MTCPTCSRPIPNDLLACAICARERSDRAVREYQYAPLRQVMARRGKLTIRAAERKLHVEMFGTEQTYCGIFLSPQHRKSWIEFDPAQMNRLCDKCRALLFEVADEARRAA